MMMTKQSVVVVDEHVSTREMLSLVLAAEGAYDLIGQAGTGLAAVRLCRELKPRLVILDLALPELSGVEVLLRLRAESRETRVLIFTGTQHRDLTLRGLQARPHGFVHKRDTLATLREALRAVAKGCVYLTPFATALLDQQAAAAAPAWERLTEREREVLQMVAEGLKSKEMAGRLALSCKTVEHHRTHLMEKLNLHDIASLTRFAVRQGLVAVE